MGMLTTCGGSKSIHELFKYRAINEHTLSFLRTGRVYFSSPAEFNDPFDSRFIERALGVQQQRWELELRAQAPNAAPLAIAAMNSSQHRERSEGMERRVYCVSEIADSTLMWSHYADSHRGICVVLEAEEVSETWFIPFAGYSMRFAGWASTKIATDGRIEVIARDPSFSEQSVMLATSRVVYLDDVPGQVVFCPSHNGSTRAVPFELVKHTSWAYQRERRIVVANTMLADNPAQLASEAITGVIFGLKITKPDVLRVHAAIDDCPRARPIMYSRMIERPKSFGLVRVPVSDLDAFIGSL